MTQTLILRSPEQRRLAHALIDKAPDGIVVTFSEPKRSLDQNALMWALLSDVSREKPDGRKLVPEVWKSLFLHALGHAQRFEMALDGNGHVPVGFRSSRLTKPQFSDLIETIYEFGARHNVRWSDPAERKAA